MTIPWLRHDAVSMPTFSAMVDERRFGGVDVPVSRK